MITYDLIVIGAGSAGLSLSLSMHALGFKVLLISKSDKDIGGECLNDGCVPSKSMLHLAKQIKSSRAISEFGYTFSGKTDIQRIVKTIQKHQSIIRKHENYESLTQQGLTVVLGEAHFTGQNTIQVKDQLYHGKKIVIATGSKPLHLKVPGIESVKWYTNENIFTIDELPRRFLVIGAGPLGIELAQAFSCFGSKVTVLTESDRILEHDEVEIAEVLVDQLKGQGIDFIFNAKIHKFVNANTAELKFSSEHNNKNQGDTISFDAVLVAIGRELVLDSLRLEKAGVQVESNKIERDEYLRTSNKSVYVCGDVASDLELSHAAEHHARILMNNFLSPFKRKLSNDHMSWVTFTQPELASFGLSETELKKEGIRYIKLCQDFGQDDRAVTDGYRYGKTVVYISEGTAFTKKKILGGSMVCPHAGEIVQELILANTSGLSINEIFNKIYPYPVASRINQQLIVKYKQSTITPLIRRLLHLSFKFFG